MCMSCSSSASPSMRSWLAMGGVRWQESGSVVRHSPQPLPGIFDGEIDSLL